MVNYTLCYDGDTRVVDCEGGEGRGGDCRGGMFVDCGRVWEWNVRRLRGPGNCGVECS